MSLCMGCGKLHGKDRSTRYEGVCSDKCAHIISRRFEILIKWMYEAKRLNSLINNITNILELPVTRIEEKIEDIEFYNKHISVDNSLIEESIEFLKYIKEILNKREE